MRLRVLLTSPTGKLLARNCVPKKHNNVVAYAISYLKFDARKETEKVNVHKSREVLAVLLRINTQEIPDEL